MTDIKIYQVDAFTDTLFSGNPAAVCVSDNWLADEIMQSVAMENNLAETAFIVRQGNDFGIRWFTPVTEVDLCGHATLASAFVLFHVLNYEEPLIRFQSPRSGLLTVSKKEEMLYLDFPTDQVERVSGMEAVIESCIGVKPLEVYKGKTDYIAVIADEEAVINTRPDLKEIAKLKARGLVVTAAGDRADVVSRFFAPQSGIDEDPVTGSAHTSLLPIWSGKLGKNKFVAYQLSARGGRLLCEYHHDRCMIGGQAKLYLTGVIHLD